MSRVFRFKQFAVDDSASGMKVGTDAVLLGALANHSPTASVLDIGTGSGLIALMLAQRFPTANITGVEIDASAAQQAEINFQQSPWAERLASVHADVQQWQPPQLFDLIVSNPPYFNKGFPIIDPQRKNAREQESLACAGLMQFVAQWLHANGSFWMVSPVDYFLQAKTKMQDLGLSLRHQTNIQASVSKDPNRVVACFTKEQQPAAQLSTIVIRSSDNSYTQQYLELTAPFYLFA